MIAKLFQTQLQITPEKGLSKGDADDLLSRLQDQAKANAREVRVIVFNLPRQEECQQLETYSFSTSLKATAIEESVHEKVSVDDSMNSQFYDSGMKQTVLENASGL
ncbi:hypothetical protein PVL29_024600 [Vitis rotundifolia]|uniref:Uncharacterized protein n=1 Tax=Vitis rotundifolia TaxID=103349 RepID=A0AA38YSA2_VITRO|nr:hypothetical protein PVL29_024600 [Vitis rotundifolia]